MATAVTFALKRSSRYGVSYSLEVAKVQIYFSLLVALIGVLMYALCVNPKLARIGEIMFQCGLLAFLLTGVQKVIEVIGK